MINYKDYLQYIQENKPLLKILSDNESLVFNYSPPMKTTQPGHITVSDFISYEAIEKNVRLVPLEIKDMAVKAEKPEEESKEKPVKESVEDEFIDEEEYEHGYTEAQSWFHDGNRFDHYDNDEVSDDFWEGFCDGWNDAENDINKFEEEEPDDTGNEYKESVQYSKDGITRTYLDEGIISREELNKIISESESINENSLDAEVLEYNFPESEILTTDKNAFIITGNEIKKLGV